MLQSAMCNKTIICMYYSTVMGLYVTGFAKTVPIGTTIEIHFMA